MKKALKILLALLLLSVIFTVSVNFFMVKKFSPLIYSEAAGIPPAQAALVLGASVRSRGKPSSVLLERLEKAVELYRLKKVKKLLLSGDNSQRFYDEVNVMKNYVLKRRVDPSDIFLDHTGIRTLDSIYRAAGIYRAENIIIISQDFHLPRALFLAEHAALPATGLSATSGKVRISFKTRFREYSARVLAFLDVYFLRRKPRFSGKEIPLSQDGKKTWDKLKTY